MPAKCPNCKGRLDSSGNCPNCDEDRPRPKGKKGK